MNFTNVGVPSTPSTTVLLTQISDGADYLSLVSDDDFDAVLKLNILFFDRMALGSPDLIGNRRLFAYLQEEPQAFERLIGAGPRASILTPTLWNHNQNLSEVAERMVHSHTIHSLESEANLVRHAKMLDSFNPTFFWVNEADYRDRYLSQTIDLLAKRDTISDQVLSSAMPSQKSVDQALHWLNSIDNYKKFNCSAFYRFIDTFAMNEDARSLKLIGDTVAHYALSSSLDCRISVPHQVNPFVTILRSQSPLSAEDDNLADDFIETTFRIDALRILKLEDVLKLRDTESVSHVRSHLASIREGYVRTDIEQIANAMTECAGQLLDYAFRNKSGREHFLNMQADKKKMIRIRSIFNLAGYGAPVAVAFVLGGETNFALLTIVQAAMYGMKSIYDKVIDKVQGANMTHSAISKVVNGVEGSYDPIEGRLRRSD